MFSQQKIPYVFRIITVFCVGIFFLEILFLRFLPEFDNMGLASISFIQQPVAPVKKTSDQRRKTGPEIRKYFRLTYVTQYFHSLSQLLDVPRTLLSLIFLITTLFLFRTFLFLFSFFDSRRIISFYYVFVASN